MAKSKYLLHPNHPLRTFVYVILALGFIVGGYFTLKASQMSTEGRSKAAETEQIINQWEFASLQFWTKTNFATGNFDSTNWNTTVVSARLNSTLEQTRIPKPLPSGTKKLKIMVKVNDSRVKGPSPTPSGVPYSGEVRYMLAGKTTWEPALPFNWKIDGQPYEHVLTLPNIPEITISKLQITLFPLPSGTQVSFDYIRLTAIPLPTPTPIFGSAALLNSNGENNQYIKINQDFRFQHPVSKKTIEAWIYLTNIHKSPYSTQIINSSSPPQGLVWVLQVTNNKLLSYSGLIDIRGNGSSQYYCTLTGRTIIQEKKWYHIAIVKSDSPYGTIKMYLNGVEDGRKICYEVGPLTLPLIGIGGPPYPGWSVPVYFEGLIDEIRFSSSIRYLSNFTPPTMPFINDGTTTGLWHLNGDTLDSSGYKNIGEKVGNVQFVNSTIIQ